MLVHHLQTTERVVVLILCTAHKLLQVSHAGPNLCPVLGDPPVKLRDLFELVRRVCNAIQGMPFADILVTSRGHPADPQQG